MNLPVNYQKFSVPNFSSRVQILSKVFHIPLLVTNILSVTKNSSLQIFPVTNLYKFLEVSKVFTFCESFCQFSVPNFSSPVQIFSKVFHIPLLVTNILSITKNFILQIFCHEFVQIPSSFQGFHILWIFLSITKNFQFQIFRHVYKFLAKCFTFHC